MTQLLKFLSLVLIFACCNELLAQTPLPLDHAAELKIEPKMVGTLVLSDESPLQVLELLEQMTGKIILRRQDLSPAKINFNSRGPISQSDAILALKSLLTLNGIMLTEMGHRFMKAVPATEVNRHVPEMLVGSSLNLPPSQQIYAKLFKFNYLNVEQASGSLVNPLLSRNSSFINFPKSNAMLITDALINLQRIETIIQQADRAHSVRESIQFIKLQFVQAEMMQNRLEQLIQGPLKNYLEGNTNISFDQRTNQIILITHTSNLATIKQFIDRIDVDAAPLTASEVFALRQAKAEQVVTIIEAIISGQKEGREDEAKLTRQLDQKNEPASNSLQPVLPKPLMETLAQTKPSNSTLQFSSFVGLSADLRTNSIVAYGTLQDIRSLQQLIEKIDVPLPQVRIEAIISEVSLNDNQSSGITSLGFTLTEEGDLSFGASLFDDNGNVVVSDSAGGIFGSGFSLTGNVDGLVNAVLAAAESDSDVRILSTPTIVVSHNEEGVVNVSESRPIITSSTSSLDNSGNARSSVEFRDIGIKLTVTPLIGADGSVQMKIEQTVDNVTGTTKIDGNDQPIIGRREATSTITVSSGEVIVLGGLQENRRNDSNAYFPLLGKLPLLKKVFGGETTSYARTELIIFIRPTVLASKADTIALTQQQIETLEDGPVIQHILDGGDAGGVYMQGSKFQQNSAATNDVHEQAAAANR